MSSVLIQRDESFQPIGIWVFVNDARVVRGKLISLNEYTDGEIEQFISTLEEMPACDESSNALIEDDGYLSECPNAWR